MKHIPNLFTLLNLVLGCIAIIFILQTGETIVLLQQGGFTQINLPEKITWGALCIFGAAVIDFLDGFLARLLKADSEMGKQLDSLADVVSFGVAPGLIIFQLLRLSFAQEENGLDVSLIWLLPALIIPCAAAWRLARYNITVHTDENFSGVPTPAVGLFIATLPLALHYQRIGNINEIILNEWVLYFIIAAVSFLMVSRLYMLSMKPKSFSIQNNITRIILIVIAIVSIVLIGWLSGAVIFAAYVILSLITKRNKHDVYSAG